MDKLIIAKQASDSHTNLFSQCTISNHLAHNNLDAHISHIKTLYKKQSCVLISAIRNCFPYTEELTTRTLRLNYTNSDSNTIEEDSKRLVQVIKELYKIQNNKTKNERMFI